MKVTSVMELDATLEQLQQLGLVYLRRPPQPTALFCDVILGRLIHSILLADLSSLELVQAQLAQKLGCEASAAAILRAVKSLKQPHVLVICSDKVTLPVLEYLFQLSAVSDTGCSHLPLLVLETAALRPLWQTEAGACLLQRFAVSLAITQPATNTGMVTAAVIALFLAGASLGYLVGWSDWGKGLPEEAQPSVVVDQDAAEPEPVLMTAQDQRQVRQTIEGWRQAWEQQKWEAYENCYVSYYLPLDDDLSHEQWVSWRRARLERPDWISVNISEIRLVPLDHYQVRVTFRQTYAAPDYRDTAFKELYLVRLAEGWRINAERSLRALK